MTVIRDINGNTITNRSLQSLIHNLHEVTSWQRDSRGVYTVDFSAWRNREQDLLPLVAFIRPETHNEVMAIGRVKLINPGKEVT